MKLLLEKWLELINHIPQSWKGYISLERKKYLHTKKNIYVEGRLKEDSVYDIEATENETGHKMLPTGWFNSYYIGPTDDSVINALPTPLHAADYIAQQHDLEYKELGLNGISGTFSPKSREADERLIKRCNELIKNYDEGNKLYHGYEISEEAHLAAQFMREYFITEETISKLLNK